MCGSKTIFSTLKLIMRPEQWFEFDMPALHELDQLLFHRSSKPGMARAERERDSLFPRKTPAKTST
jgi:hypothetical protein